MGDVVLQNLAQILSGSIRRTDIVARYGGEEFLIIIPHTGMSEAFDLAERIRLIVQESEVAHFRTRAGRQPIHVTVSAGAATFEKDMVDTRALIERADAALYQAKSEGRNRVVAADTGMGSPAE